MVVKKNKYVMVSSEHYERISAKYMQFLDALNDVNREPVKVFDPLSQKIVDELILIREVSKDLQKKKEEDMKKQAAKEAEELLQKKDEESTEVKKDDLIV